jgi:release factor glutamine methyltransferase
MREQEVVERAVVARLRAAGCVWAEDEARLLLAAAGEHAEPAAALERLVAARVRGTPLEHVLGWVDFAGVRVAVDPGVFVPRRRTELLVDLAAAHAPAAPVVVELCCGSGAVARALARRVAPAEVHAADIDPAAVACARRNLAGIAAVHCGDLYDALPGRLRGCVDVLVVNAPYVPTDELELLPVEARGHEPPHALDGGADGVDVHRRVAAGAPAWLSARGLVVIETSSRQAALTVAALSAAGLDVRVERDEARGAVAVRGVRPLAAG